jgi:peptidoglycan/LPS O-acetylase OafA/YrhL
MKKGYIPALDGLRFLAVALVLVDHWSGDAMPFQASYLGVCLFFVLSGFLITRILLNAKQRDEKLERNHSFSLKQFYIRRTIRIFPVYYLTLGILYILNVEPVRDKIIWLLTYNTNNYIAIYERWLGSVDHLWSLAVEEQFYLFFPFLILFLGWKNLSKMLYLCIILSVGLRLFFYLRGDEWVRPYVLVFTCLDAFGIGGLFAYYVWQGKQRVIEFFGGWLPIGMSLVAYILIVIWSKSYGEGHNFVTDVLLRLFESLLSISIIGKIVVNEYQQTANWLTRLLSSAVLVYIGKISYGIYIYHNFVYNFYHTPDSSFISRALNKLQSVVSEPVLFQITKICFLSAITIIMASFSWFLIEKPINKFKERFGY